MGAIFDTCNEKKFKPFFPHPSTKDRVYCFFDACHMLKLVRNYLSSKSLIYQGNKISWYYIKEINDRQYEEQLHASCKIKYRHIYFEREKMKVSLAAETLSRSASLLLTYFEKDLKDPDFQGASTTAQYLLAFNDIFDILNAKDMYDIDEKKRGIKRENFEKIKIEIDEHIAYIKNLEVDVKFYPKEPKNISQKSAKKK